MNNGTALLKYGLMWGSLLWLACYIAGIILFFVMPPDMIGWILTPLASLLTILLITKKMRGHNFPFYIWTGLIWTVIAILFDYFFLVKFFNLEDSYYKFDIYLYYCLMFVLPVFFGWRFSRKMNIR